MKRLRLFLPFLLGVLLCSGTLFTQVPTGSKIIGTVSDEDGAFLPGVTVEGTNPKLIGKVTSITDLNGTYRLLALTPGEYRLVFTLAGFKSIIRERVYVGIEQTINLNIVMQQGALEEEVTVIGQSPIIDVKNTLRGMTLTKDIFQLLPKGRNFDTLVTAVPGVYDDTDLLAGISVDGASGAENMFYVDGMDTTNPYTGASGQSVSFDFADEVQFKASGYNAEYGGSVGGVINVVTRSGGNEFHGEVLGYFSGTALEGKRRKELSLNYQEGSRTATYYSYDQYYGDTSDKRFEGGFALGGFILKDRLWFFGSVMPVYFERYRNMDFAIQNKPGVFNDYTRKEYAYNISAKITAQPFGKLRLGGSFVNNFYKYKGDNASAASASATTDYEIYGYSYPNWTVSGYADYTISNNALLSVRGGYFFTNSKDQLAPVSSTPWYAFQSEQPYSYASNTNQGMPGIPPEFVQVAGWQSFSRAQVMNRLSNIRDRLNFNADFTYYMNFAGEHAWKAGIGFMRRSEDFDDGSIQPIIYLTWDQDFEAYGTNYGRGEYGWYAVRGNADSGPYGNKYKVTMNAWSLFLQDSWTIANKLTLNMGIRAESEYLPSYTTDPAYAHITDPVNFPFSKKLAPRLGVVYDVFGDSSLKLYGTFGIYHDVMKLNMGANALGGFKWKSAYYTLDDYDYTKIGVNDIYPGTLLTVLDFRSPVFDSIDPDLKPFTQREISLGVEKMLGEDMSVSLRLVQKKVLSAIEDCGVVLPDVGEYYYYTEPGSDFLWSKYQESMAAGLMPSNVPRMPHSKRDYYGMNLALDKRLSNNWLGGISYTLSRLEGNFTGLASGDERGRNSPNGERFFDLWHMGWTKDLEPVDGPLPTDRTHAFKAYGSYVFDWGLTLGATVNAYSGNPVTEMWNVDTPNFLPFNRGNLGRTPFLWWADLYAEYTLKFGGRYRLAFNANITNLFNTDTANWVYWNKYITNVTPGDEALASANWEPSPNARLDPRYQKEYNFFDPIAVRLGVKFTF
ncbi:MAG: TonB-dependent receptor [Candidatus Aminicenantales bacterium]